MAANLIISGSNRARVEEEYRNEIARRQAAGQSLEGITAQVAPIGGNSGTAATPEQRMGTVGKYTSVADYYPTGANIPQTVLNQAKAVGNVTIPDTLNSGTMSSGSPTNFVTNTPGTITYPELDTTGLSEPEKTSQNLRNELININKNLEGQGAFREQQMGNLGVDALEQTKRDLTSQLQTINNEAKAIGFKTAEPNQTASMLNAEQREKLTQNSIKAWGVAAQLDATNGNLQAAYDKIDRLVEAKYGDIERRSKILRDNLSIIEDSPAYKAAEKKAAATLKAEQDKKDAAMDIAKDVTTQINKLLLDPQFQRTAPASIKRQLNELALKTDLTQADFVTAANLASRYTVAPEKITTEGTKFLDPLEVQRLKEQYPDLDISINDTMETARAKVAAANNPDTQTRNLIVAAKDAGNDLQTVINEINNDSTIKDKTKAIQIAKEVFGNQIATTKPIPLSTGTLKGDLGLAGQVLSSGFQQLNKLNTNFVDSITNYLFGK